LLARWTEASPLISFRSYSVQILGWTQAWKITLSAANSWARIAHQSSAVTGERCGLENWFRKKRIRSASFARNPRSLHTHFLESIWNPEGSTKSTSMRPIWIILDTHPPDASEKSWTEKEEHSQGEHTLMVMPELIDWVKRNLSTLTKISQS